MRGLFDPNLLFPGEERTRLYAAVSSARHREPGPEICRYPLNEPFSNSLQLLKRAGPASGRERAPAGGRKLARALGSQKGVT